MKRRALITSLWKIWVATILFQQTKIHWGMKIWKLTLRRSSGVNNTLRQSLSLQSLLRTISEEVKPKYSNSESGNAGAPETTSTSSPSMYASLTASSSVSPWSPTTSCSRTPPGFPDSPRPFPQEISLQGHMEVDGNGKMSSGRTYNWLSICLRWSDLLIQDHTFLRHSLE